MSIPYLSEADVSSMASLPEVIDALEDILRRQGSGADNIPKSLTTWDPASSAHTLGGIDTTLGLCAFKNWVNTPVGAQAVLSLFDSVSGRLLAVVEANHLGSLRTAGIAGLATRRLAAPEARELAVVGSGRQALRQVEAVAAVRPLDRVRVWSPTPENREKFADVVRDELGLTVVVASSYAEAIDGAPIVTLVTRAREPFVGAADFRGTAVHVNAMGAVLPANGEIATDVVRTADLVAVDNLENARRGSRELIDGCGPDLAGVVELGRLLAKGRGRPDGTRLTVFKAMGMGLSDLAAATVVARKAGIERTSP